MPPCGTPVAVGARTGWSIQPAGSPWRRMACSMEIVARTQSCERLSQQERMSPAKIQGADQRSDNPR